MKCGRSPLKTGAELTSQCLWRLVEPKRDDFTTRYNRKQQALQNCTLLAVSVVWQVLLLRHWELKLDVKLATQSCTFAAFSLTVWCVRSLQMLVPCTYMILFAIREAELKCVKGLEEIYAQSIRLWGSNIQTDEQTVVSQHQPPRQNTPLIASCTIISVG